MDRDLRVQLSTVDEVDLERYLSRYIERALHSLAEAGELLPEVSAAGTWITGQLVVLREFAGREWFDRENIIDAIEIAAAVPETVTLVLGDQMQAMRDQLRPQSDLLTVVVERSEVESRDTRRVAGLLRDLMASTAQARQWQGALDLRIAGYDTHPEELFEILEVRTYIQQLSREFPYWLYFASTKSSSLQMIALCHLPSGLTGDEKRAQFPLRLHDLLMGRWIPALNEIADFAGLAPEELRAVSDRAIDYFSITAAV